MTTAADSPQTSSLFSLRNLLLADAATCTAMGLLLVLGSAPLARLTELPAALLDHAGIALLPIAAVMLLIAMRPALQPAGAWLIIAGNAAWVAASFGLLLSGWVAPNASGIAFVVVQALAVAGLAKLEHGALRRA